MSETIDILIADDHPLFLGGLRQVIEVVGHFNIVAEANDGTTALNDLRKLQPRIAILDLHMPQVDGFEALEKLRAKDSQVPVIVMTGYYPEDVVFERIQGLGVNKVLRKPVMITSLMTTVREVAGTAA